MLLNLSSGRAGGRVGVNNVLPSGRAGGRVNVFNVLPWAGQEEGLMLLMFSLGRQEGGLMSVTVLPGWVEKG